MSILITFLTCDKNAPQKQPKGERLILTHDLKGFSPHGGEDVKEQSKALTSGWWGRKQTPNPGLASSPPPPPLHFIPSRIPAYWMLLATFREAFALHQTSLGMSTWTYPEASFTSIGISPSYPADTTLSGSPCIKCKTSTIQCWEKLGLCSFPWGCKS